MEKLNKMLEGKVFAAGEITWIDFVLAEFMQNLWMLQHDFVEGYENLWEHQKRIWEMAEIKSYHESDRYQEAPINYPPYASWTGV